MSDTFLFKIGDIVRFKGIRLVAPHLSRKSIEVLLILERISQECSGGVQRHYLCRAFGTREGTFGVGKDAQRYNEIELEMAAEAEKP